MTRLLFAAAAAALVTTPAFAQDPAAHSFVRDGVTYTYTAIDKDGAKLLQGTANGAPFVLEVRGALVTGTANGMPVSFTYKEKSVAVASR